MTKVLTIGNSFADNATRFMDEIVAADGTTELVIGKANIGGCSLVKHWNLVEQCDLLPDVKPYPFKKTGEDVVPSTLRDALTSDNWDYVTLQQVSNDSWRPETFSPHIEKLHGLVRELAPQATPVIHQTWAYRTDATFFDDIEEDLGQGRMYQQLTANYERYSDAFRCRILPCGHAFQAARKQLGFEPDTAYDYANPTPLDLPDQSRSLIIGYFWATGNTRSGKAELHMDYRHGNALGCYLANAVWFEMFTGRDIRPNSFCPEGVSSDELTILKNAAHDTVATFGGPLV